MLKMAKAGAEFWANLLWNYDCFITLTDQTAQKALDEVLNRNEFTRRTNALTEKAFALGTGAYVVENLPNSPPRINYLSAASIYPLEWMGDECVSCAFADETVEKNGERVLYLAIHERTSAGSYRIRNLFYSLKSGAPVPIPPMDGVAEECTSSIRLFALIRPNIANNLTLGAADSPMGVSVYANCIDTLETLDLCYDGLKVALKLGRPRIATMVDALNIDNEGQSPTFDTNDTVFYRFPMPEGVGDSKLIQDITTEYRAGNFEESLEKCATLYSMQLGLGDKAFKWDGSKHIMQTATQVIAESSTMLRAMQKHQEALRKPMEDVVRAVLALSGIGYTGEVTVNFDDSVTRDKEAEKNHVWNWVMAGKYPFWAYLVNYWGYTEEDARKLENEAQTANYEPQFGGE
jgi:A118 family predicted phage portal protein